MTEPLLLDNEVREIVAQAMHRCRGDFVTSWEEIAPRLSMENLFKGERVFVSIDDAPLVAFDWKGSGWSYRYCEPVEFDVRLPPYEPPPPEPWPSDPSVGKGQPLTTWIRNRGD